MERKQVIAEAKSLLERRRINIDHVVLLSEVGSTAHGISVKDQDDLDLTAVRFETNWHELITGSSKRQSMMVRTKPEGVRSEPGDVDINVYTVRKFASLAAKGNPSILAALLSSNKAIESTAVTWERLERRIASKRAGYAFLGYMTQQLDRWQGKSSKKVSRPELVEKYGYDTKYAAHVIRLGIQGVEYMTTGYFNMPMEPTLAAEVRAIRKGHVKEGEALRSARYLKRTLEDLIHRSPLPDEPGNWEEWVSGTYWHWFT